MNIDGSDKRMLFSGGNIGYMFIVDDLIYYTDRDGIYTIKTDGSEKNKIYDSARAFDFWQMSGDRFYFGISIGSQGQTIYSIKTDGSDFKTIYFDGNEYLDGYENNVVIYDERIYFAKWNDKFKLYSMKTDGSDMVKLTDDGIGGFNIVNGKIYYVNCSDNRKTYFMYLDGSDNRMFITN